MSDTTSTVEMESRPVFSFTAIVVKEQMKLALILNVIDPKLVGYDYG
jgi:Mg-chelatase subunit ChlI